MNPEPTMDTAHIPPSQAFQEPNTEDPHLGKSGAEPPMDREPLRDGGVAGEDRKSATILVTDDSPAVVELLAAYLKLNGYGVLQASNGAEALRVAAAERPDLILLDVMMPQMDGLTACRRLKVDPDLSAIPVIMITAMHDPDDVVRGLDAGADDYVTKPVNFQILGARLRSALRAKRAQDTIAEINRELADELAHRKRVELELAHVHKLEAIGRLAAGIAHEINTPAQYVGDNLRFLKDAFDGLETLLAGLAGFATEAGESETAAARLAQIKTQTEDADLSYLCREIPVALQQSLEGVEQIAGIVRAMKEFAHPGCEDKQPVDINQLIENTLTVTRNQWKHVAEVTTDFDPSLPPVPCVAASMRQVILNLLVNAAEAIAEAIADGPARMGTITVRTSRQNEWLEIQVADTGKGIPKEIQPKVFEPFFTTKDVGKGTGQGLALARAIVFEKHGGTIHFQTEVGRGTTFVVRLPISKSPPSTQTTRTMSSGSAPVAPSGT